jgi:hypothetical protein
MMDSQLRWKTLERCTNSLQQVIADVVEMSREENVTVVETHINTFPDKERLAWWRPVRHGENAGFGGRVNVMIGQS